MPADQKEEIRSRNDIVDVVSGYVTLKRSGNRFVGLCPFHQEKTPSFHVSRERQAYHCFGCGAGGDVFDFVMRHDGLDFVQAASKLAERVGLRFEVGGEHSQRRSEREQLYKLNDQVRQWYRDALLESPAAQVARDYLQRRGVDEAISEKFQLGYAPNTWDALTKRLTEKGVDLEAAQKAGVVGRRKDGSGWFDWFRGRLMFPIWDVTGNVVGFGGRTLFDDRAKYVNTAETPVFNKGDLLYALNFAVREIAARSEALLVEGYMDALALHQFGVSNVVATMGTAVTPRAARMLARYGRSVVCAFDGDSAGMTAVMRGAAIFQEQDLKVRVVEVPEGLDPDDWVRQQGVEVFREGAEKAVSLIDYQLNRALRKLPPDNRRVTGEMIREVLPLLRHYRSPIEREEQIQHLAARWCGDDLGRVREFEAAIRQELKQQVRSRPATGAAAAPRPEPRRPQRSAGFARAEQELLSVMVHDSRAARYVRERFPVEGFAEPVTRTAVEALYSQVGGVVQVPLDRVLDATDDAEAKALLTRLALEPVAMGNTEAELDAQMERLRDRARADRREELRQLVARRLEQGELDSSDPLFREFQELERHFRHGVK